jgi:hypothetical protein
MNEALRYFGFRVFQSLLKPFSGAARARRMTEFVEALSVRPQERVIDLGGEPAIWSLVEIPLNVTIVNLPGVAQKPPADGRHRFSMVEGDACALYQYADNSFDIVFSNSVIEHVGGEAEQAAFAREARRLARRYWVQTPSIWFPVEAHTGFPFWFVLPRAFRALMMRRWRGKLPEWTDMVAGTTVISRRRLSALFPDAVFRAERKFGVVKSNIAYKT